MASKKNQSSAPKSTEAPEQDQITLSGYIVRNPVLRHTQTSGKAVANLDLGVKDGEETSYHRVVVWGKTAEAVCKFLKAGCEIEVTGRSTERTYKDRDGNDRQATEINAFRVQFLPRKQQETSDQQVAA
jgi:single-strand DNA-binding protein